MLLDEANDEALSLNVDTISSGHCQLANAHVDEVVETLSQSAGSDQEDCSLINESLSDAEKLAIAQGDLSGCRQHFHSDFNLNISGNTLPAYCVSCIKCRTDKNLSRSSRPRKVRRSVSLPFDYISQPSSQPAQVGAKRRTLSGPARQGRLEIHCIRPELTRSTMQQQQSPLSLSARISSLFTFGVILALVLNFLQKQKNVTIFPPGVFGDCLNSAWWVPPLFGLGSTIVGLLYPFLDRVVGQKKSFTMEWSSVMRCIALFVGINHACAKINFESNIHLSLVLAVLSLGLWYFFDQSLLGLGLGAISTGVATFVTQLLVALNVFGYSDPDFLYMRSWVPWLYFSGGITVGAVGRALAGIQPEPTIKEHID